MTPRPTIPEILAAVAADTGVQAWQFSLGRTGWKRREYIRPRAIAAYLLRYWLGMSLPEIALTLGYRSHTGPLKAINDERQREDNTATRNRIYESILQARTQHANPIRPATGTSQPAAQPDQDISRGGGNEAAIGHR